MEDLHLADRVLAAFAETERLDRRSIVRGDQLMARLDAAFADARGTPDTQELVRYPPGVGAGDVVRFQAAGRAHDGVPIQDDDQRGLTA